jgi:hypothetical protein
MRRKPKDLRIRARHEAAARGAGWDSLDALLGDPDCSLATIAGVLGVTKGGARHMRTTAGWGGIRPHFQDATPAQRQRMRRSTKVDMPTPVYRRRRRFAEGVETGPVNVTFPLELIAALDVRAAELGTTRSELIRRGAEMVLAPPPDAR